MFRSAAVAVVMGGALLAPIFSTSSVCAQQAPRKLLVVELDPGSSGIDPDAVRQAIATELGVDVADQPVAGSVGTLLVRVTDDNEATVVFRAPDGKRSIERSVTLPQDPTVRHEAIALLAGNLARDEAKELADALAAAREARRLEKQRQAREAAAQQAATDAAAAAGAAAAARTESVEAAAKKRDAARRAAAASATDETPDAAAGEGGEERGGDPAQPKAEELHDRINARVEEQSEAFASLDEYPIEPFQAALTSPVAIYPNAREMRFHGMLSLLYVDAGGLEGAAVTVGVHRIRGNVRGAQAAGIWNDVEGLHYGAQAAGIGNRGAGPLRGAEAAGILNLRKGAVQGAQAAGIFNTADAVEGVQTAGIYNQNAHELLGAQAAAVANYSGSDVTGVQAAGVANVAWGFVDGAQLAGVTNIADQSVEGAQISALYNQAQDVEGAQIGLVNVGRDVRGTQIGLVNISRRFQGFPVGLVNISQTGRYQLVMWHERKAELNPDTVGAGFNVGVKFLAGKGYSLFGFGGDGRDSTWAANAALGARFPIKPLFIELDVMYRGEWDARASNENDAQAIHYRGKLGVEVVPERFGVFVGGGVRHAFIPNAGQLEMEFGPIALAGVEVF